MEEMLSNLWSIVQAMMIVVGVVLVVALSTVFTILIWKAVSWIVGKIINEE